MASTSRATAGSSKRKRRPRKNNRQQYSKMRLSHRQHLKTLLLEHGVSLNTLTTAITISATQYAKIQPYSKILSRSQGQGQPKWASQQPCGSLYNTNGTGILLATAEDVTAQVPGYTVFFTGHGSISSVVNGGSSTNIPVDPKTLVLLGLWSNTSAKPTTTEEIEFDAGLSSIASDVKYNLYNGAKHHGSYGQCVGFGCRAAYEPLDAKTTASFGQYRCKQNKTAGKLKNKVSDLLENWTVSCLKHGASTINRVFEGGNIVRDGSTVIEYLVDECKAQHSDLAQRLHLLHDSNFASGYFLTNSGTKLPHTEHDASYTLLCVPKQPHNPTHKDTPLRFNFHLNSNHVERIPMVHGTVIYYSALLLSHQQDFISCSPTEYYNVAGYGTEHLVQNVEATIRRLSNHSKGI